MKFIKEDEKDDYGILDEYGVVYSLDERSVIGFKKEHLKYCKIKGGCTILSPSSYKNRFVIDNIDIPSSLWSYIRDDYDYTEEGLYIRKSFKVSDFNPYFSDKRGILFDKKQKTLLECPYEYECTEYTIPSTVSYIKKMAFENNKTIETLIIPRNVKWIERRAFNCENLNKVMMISDFVVFEDEPFGYSVKDFTILANEININGAFFTDLPKKITILTNNLYSSCDDFLTRDYYMDSNERKLIKEQKDVVFTEIVVPIGKIEEFKRLLPEEYHDILREINEEEGEEIREFIKTHGNDKYMLDLLDKFTTDLAKENLKTLSEENPFIKQLANEFDASV
ncbi:MAG: leucine-rich repeat protein [Bacteroidales bacterium]|nr:leucine-rich repeat protein [Bacteroidales bacterium]